MQSANCCDNVGDINERQGETRREREGSSIHCAGQAGHWAAAAKYDDLNTHCAAAATVPGPWSQMCLRIIFGVNIALKVLAFK